MVGGGKLIGLAEELAAAGLQIGLIVEIGHALAGGFQCGVFPLQGLLHGGQELANLVGVGMLTGQRRAGRLALPAILVGGGL